MNLHHLGIVNLSTLPPDEVSWAVEAVRLQLAEAATAWALPVPGVAQYARGEYVPTSEGALIYVADNDGDPASLGYHTELAGVPSGIVGARETDRWTVTLSHEALEMLGDLMLDTWIMDSAGVRWWRELCDPDQAGSYGQLVEKFGQKRTVQVSNYVLPAWFDLGGSRFDYLGRLSRSFEIAPGGYAMVIENGRVVERSSGSVRMSRRQWFEWGRKRKMLETQAS